LNDLFTSYATRKGEKENGWPRKKSQICSSIFKSALEKVKKGIFTVIPAKAGIQNPLF
jgi:hypothetical protein